MTSRIKDQTLSAGAAAALPWLDRNIPVTQQIATDLSPAVLRNHAISLNIHLDLKMIPVVRALRRAEARLVVVGANPHTTRDDVAAAMVALGAEVYAWAGMSEQDRHAAIAWALGREGEFICEMGGDVTAAALSGVTDRRGPLRAAMEATGTGITRLQQLCLSIRVFNWDDLEIKQGLHNRHLVGLMVWNTYLNITPHALWPTRARRWLRSCRARDRLLHTCLGGTGSRLRPQPRPSASAMHEGCDVVALAEGLRESDMVVTATGRDGVIGAKELLQLRDRCVLANVGHSNLEIDIPALRRYPMAQLGPALEEVDLGDRRIYLLAEGAMLNLAAGPGDPYDAFDFTSAVMLAGIEFMVRHHADYPPGIYLLPEGVEQRIAALAMRSRPPRGH